MRRHRICILLFVLLVLAAGLGTGCSSPSEPAPPAEPPTPPTAEPPSSEGEVDDPPPAAEAVRVVVLGDSLAAGLSLGEEQAFPALVEAALQSRGWRVSVINAGVSGDTTAGGLRRLSWLLRQEPDVLVVELGGNDGLRGLSLDQTEENLRQILLEGQQAGARLLLLGMRIPPNYGVEYTEPFAAIYPRLAEELDIALMPFFLEGVGGDPELNLPDGIHPNPRGHEILAESLLPFLEPLVEAEATARGLVPAAAGEATAR